MRNSMKNRFEFVPGIQHGEVKINNTGIEQFHPNSSLEDLSFKQEEFVREANSLLDKYEIRVPPDFPKPVITKEAIWGKPVHTYHNQKVGVCFCNCIQLERKYDINTSKLLSELIKPDPVEGLLHSTSISIITLGYSDSGCKVELFPENETTRKPDLLINGVTCDVKVIQKSDWIKEAMESKHVHELLTTGTGLRHYISDDICFDIGKFVENRAHEGILQADMLLVDLTEKSLGDLIKADIAPNQVLPSPKSNRIVFFGRAFYEGSIEFAYHLDFDPSLWEIIRSCKVTRRGSISPSGFVITAEGTIIE